MLSGYFFSNDCTLAITPTPGNLKNRENEMEKIKKLLDLLRILWRNFIAKHASKAICPYFCRREKLIFGRFTFTPIPSGRVRLPPNLSRYWMPQNIPYNVLNFKVRLWGTPNSAHTSLSQPINRNPFSIIISSAPIKPTN